ncbi:MAG: carbamoyl-phosphate synthase large subunit [Clostridia bacterium]|nr:carbamoyl-phosphate synthase large subunit [Clostridia bacterium]
MPLRSDIKKVLVIGSGPIVIGQAAEFDYAGAQACRVLKDAGVNVVLVNSNPATIMTDKALADEIYLEPLTLASIKRIIEKERPDGILGSLGGQTGLTMAMQLSKEGFLDKMGVELLGTNAEAIDLAEDRKLFKETMESIGQPCIPSDVASTVEDCLAIAERIGYPVIVRPAFTLGGSGGGVAYSSGELEIIAATGIDLSPISQVLIEKYIYGWKEIEFETMRDSTGDAVAVCSMENVDPVGVHTGDSIVVAPALTLSEQDYEMLRQASLKIVSALGIIGGCNCQFALDPHSSQYAVIEVNPRVSRSSALASKATGYPIAKVTTKLALGYTLGEIKNEKTGKSCAGFEPQVNYIVCKFPKWPFDKFVGASRRLGTQMKATGEVMSIAPTFEMALMKAVRGAEIGLDTLSAVPIDDRSVIERLGDCDDRRIFTVYEALKSGVTVEQIHDITKITPWFIEKIKGLVDYEKTIAESGLSGNYERGKELGYTDAALERISGEKCTHVPCVYKTVDTCAEEFSVDTPYFYARRGDKCEARSAISGDKKRILVLGSGPIRIGQGIEFDYSSVHCVWTLQNLGYEVAIINNNPETVSTDYDTADRLYFEPLCPEDVMDVIAVEQPEGVVVAFGGQTAIKLTQFLDRQGITILGTSAEGIDLAEDRERFDGLLEKVGIRRPKGVGVKTLEQALAAANSLEYPVLLRPSYVIGGQNMTIAHSDADVRTYMERILAQKIENPVLVDKYMMGTELEVDVISDGETVLIPGIMEHIERAGVHSGDSIAVYPPYSITDKMTQTVIDCSRELALALGTKGLVNIQYLIYHGELYVIEVNPRASRTIPYISKVTNVPMVDLAARVMTGEKLDSLGYGSGLYKTPPYYAVKVPVFSFEKLNDVNSYLGPEMKSTGEVLGVGKNLTEALFKGLCASGIKLRSPKRGGASGVFISVDEHDHPEIVKLAKKLDDLGMKMYATEGTANAIEQLGIDVERVAQIGESDQAFRLIESGFISYIVYTGAAYDSTVDHYIALHRRALQLGIACLTSLDTANALADIIASGYTEQNTELVDINNMRTSRSILNFSKMHGSGNDYIFIENFDGKITCPESLCISLCDRNYGAGGCGIVLIEGSEIADAKMRIYNSDGSEGRMAGNSIRCVAKYLYDRDIVKKEQMTIETASGVKQLTLYTRNGKASSVTVDMGEVSLHSADIPVVSTQDKAVGISLSAAGREYTATCVSVGNPHCVIFCDRVDGAPVERVGRELEHSPLFPEGVNTEFIRVVNRNTVKMRVWERGNGETTACGTGACAAVVAAVENGLLDKCRDITVKLKGGDVVVNYDGERVLLTGDAVLVYDGRAEY